MKRFIQAVTIVFVFGVSTAHAEIDNAPELLSGVLGDVKSLSNAESANVRGEFFRNRSDAVNWCKGRGTCWVERHFFGAYYQGHDPQRWGYATKSY